MFSGHRDYGLLILMLFLTQKYHPEFDFNADFILKFSYFLF
ncbi:hypothetical protein RC62_357 [Flavobacterium aquidurense]|uniref:Uncharacterized protein n=1 Tax=Flavobacterium aquidurense TaxID=362413 RepID=A0A0Q0S4N8_9FLAO|nr:hypothetical protein RC62_357 [Flavobacterium aquidurense]